jgi:membrane-bound lytic murein transglycosylase B
MKSCRLLIIFALCLLPRLAAASDAQDLPDFIAEIRAAAEDAGISDRTINASLNNFQPIEHVIELDQRQPESAITFETYYERVATDARIEKGQQMLAENRQLLTRIADDYGVTPSILVALWGIESSFGSAQGDYPIIQSLATLSYDGRRHDFFKNELIKAMQIVDEGDISIREMKGSWAGAMGQVQFMPSTFLAYAVDYTGTGRKDIWHSDADALASAANYLSRIGWKRDELWGREVVVPARFTSALAGTDKPRTLDFWRGLGVRKIDGSALPSGDMQAAVIQPDGPDGRSFLVYNNFKTIMKWNHSTFFATTVGLLSDAIDGRE